MDAMPGDGDGEAAGLAGGTIDRVLETPGLRAQLPPCPPWPDLN